VVTITDTNGLPMTGVPTFLMEAMTFVAMFLSRTATPGPALPF
jgi:hypothetical protein